MAVGHTRYGTTGGTNRNNCQPIEVNHQKGHMALAHNGNLSNAAELRSALAGNDVYCHACFTGEYPTVIPADIRKDRFERRLSE